MTTLDVERRNEGLGAAMIAHALMRDDAAVELLAREHEDPVALATAVARAAYGGALADFAATEPIQPVRARGALRIRLVAR